MNINKLIDYILISCIIISSSFLVTKGNAFFDATFEEKPVKKPI